MGRSGGSSNGSAGGLGSQRGKAAAAQAELRVSRSAIAVAAAEHPSCHGSAPADADVAILDLCSILRQHPMKSCYVHIAFHTHHCSDSLIAAVPAGVTQSQTAAAAAAATRHAATKQQQHTAQDSNSR
jgi:hypothetical protein